MRRIIVLILFCLTVLNAAYPTTGPVTTAGSEIYCNEFSFGIPITVTGFNNVGSVSLTLNYDPQILQFDYVTLNDAISESQTNGNEPGVFTLTYQGSSGIDLPDGDILFTLGFSYTGPHEGGSSLFIWPSIPSSANEYLSPDGIPYDRDPFGDYFIDGNVTVNTLGCEPVTTAPEIVSCPEGIIFVPVTVTDFNRVSGISLTSEL